MEITLYSNYYSSEREQATREFIFDSRADDNPDWETADDISDEEVWEEMDFENSIYWDDFQKELEKFFEGQTLIVSGTVERLMQGKSLDIMNCTNVGVIVIM